jgi:hypothetical protein
MLLSLSLVLLGSLVVPALAHDSKELQAIACGANADALKEFRAAAATVLADRLSTDVLDPAKLPTATLNALITDKNAECRNAAIDAMAQRTLTEGAPFNAAKIQQTHDASRAAASLELGVVLARVAIELVRAGITERGAKEGLSRLETITGGDKFNLRGVNIDGSIPAVRIATGRYFLAGFYRFFGSLGFEKDAKGTCDALRDRARDGKSAEMREAAAVAYVSGLVVDRKAVACVAGDGLLEATVRGSAAVQTAAVGEASKALTASALSDGALLSVALDRSGRSVQGARLFCADKADETSCAATSTTGLRAAAGQALGLRWAKRVTDKKENLLAPEGVTLLPGVLPYNLRVYVGVFTSDSPEAAGAAVPALVAIYND